MWPGRGIVLRYCVLSQGRMAEVDEVGDKLRMFPGPEFVSWRPGDGGRQVPYFTGNQCVELANDVFGFNGWSSELMSTEVVEEVQNTDGSWNVSVKAVTRIILADRLGGEFHQDCGFGEAVRLKSRAQGYQKALKEASTDSMKRTLRLFGNLVGNCLYSKVYCGRIRGVKAPGVMDFDPSTLYRSTTQKCAKRVSEYEKVENDKDGDKRRRVEAYKAGTGGGLLGRSLPMVGGKPVKEEFKEVDLDMAFDDVDFENDALFE